VRLCDKEDLMVDSVRPVSPQLTDAFVCVTGCDVEDIVG
jgi:hypothetical protein